jgi:hypothetical protein
MSAGERAGVKAVLPQVPNAALAHVQPACVLVVRPAKRARQRIGLVGDGDDVHVISHQAPGKHSDLVFADMVAERGEVDAAVVIGKEYVLP